MRSGIARVFAPAAIVVTSAGLFAIASPSFAADLPLKPAIAAAYDWSGFYLGANIGGGSGNRNVNYTPNDFDSSVLFGVASATFGGASPGSPSFRSSGVLGGLQAGYNHQLDSHWLVGIETDFNWSGVKGAGSSASTPFPRFNGSALATVDEQIEWFGTVRARLGYLAVPSLLTYFTGGFAYGRVDHTANYINTSLVGIGATGPGLIGITCTVGAPVCATGSSSSIAAGWTLGAGFEYGITQNVSLKAEYMYMSLPRDLVTETAITPGNGVTVPATFNANFSRTTFNVGRVGLNYRF